MEKLKAGQSLEATVVELNWSPQFWDRTINLFMLITGPATMPDMHASFVCVLAALLSCHSVDHVPDRLHCVQLWPSTRGGGRCMLLGGGGGLDNGGGVLSQLLYLSLNGGHVAPEGEIGSNVWGR